MVSRGRFISYRVVEAAVAIPLGMAMANGVDEGWIEGWAPSARIVYALLMFVVLVFGVGSLARLISVLSFGHDIDWFPSRQRLAANSRLLITLAAAGLVFIAVAILWSDPVWRARSALAGLGALVCVLALARPAGFWEAGSMLDLRRRFGDTAVTVVYLAVGAVIIFYALTTPLD